MRGIGQLQLLLVLATHAGQHAVEDVIVALVHGLVHDARLFEQVLLNLGALDDAVLVEVNVDVLAEATRVIVSDRLGIAERLQNRIRLENLLLDPRVLATDGGQVLQDQLGGLGLAGAALATDDDALVLVEALHVVVGIVADGENVRRQLADLVVLVQADLFGRVDRQYLVRVHGHQDGARVGLKSERGRRELVQSNHCNAQTQTYIVDTSIQTLVRLT